MVTINVWKFLDQKECYKLPTIDPIAPNILQIKGFQSTKYYFVFKEKLSAFFLIKLFLFFLGWRGRIIFSSASVIFRVPMYWSFPSRHSQGYVNELEHFFQVVRGHSKSSVSHEMTMAITKIANAAEASANRYYIHEKI